MPSAGPRPCCRASSPPQSLAQPAGGRRLRQRARAGPPSCLGAAAGSRLGCNACAVQTPAAAGGGRSGGGHSGMDSPTSFVDCTQRSPLQHALLCKQHTRAAARCVGRPSNTVLGSPLGWRSVLLARKVCCRPTLLGPERVRSRLHRVTCLLPPSPRCRRGRRSVPANLLPSASPACFHRRSAVATVARAPHHTCRPSSNPAQAAASHGTARRGVRQQGGAAAAAGHGSECGGVALHQPVGAAEARGQEAGVRRVGSAANEMQEAAEQRAAVVWKPWLASLELSV